MYRKGYIAFDLDGTLATYNSGDGVQSIGAPIPNTVKLVKDLLARGYEVRIMTARVWVPRDERWNKDLANECGRQRIMIMDWCEKHIGKRLQVTCEKDYEMIALFDDRAVRVDNNTGEYTLPLALNFLFSRVS